MGISSDAQIVYGWEISLPPIDADLYEFLDSRLQGGPLGYYIGGGYDWDDSERPVVLTVSDAPSYRASDGSVRQLPPDAFDFEASRELDNRCRKFAQDRLGVTLNGFAAWHLGCDTG